MREQLYTCLAVILVGIASICLVLIPSGDAVRNPLILAIAVAVVGISVGVRRSFREQGYLDLFSPSIIPLGYVSLSTIAPAWAMLVQHHAYLGFRSAQFAPGTAPLIFLTVLGFSVGTNLPYRRLSKATQTALDTRLWLLSGRLLILVPIILGIVQLIHGGIRIRTLNQTTYDFSDTLAATAFITTVPATLLILSGTKMERQSGLPRFPDAALMVSLVLVIAMNGARAAAIGVMLCMLFAASRRSASIKTIFFSLAAIAAFAVAVVSYRAAVVGETHSTSPVAAVLADWSPVTYTTGITARGVPSVIPYKWGSTFVDSLIRQLPSPISNRLVGPPLHTGSAVFRDLTGLHDPNQGYGYSLPAEGYLNLGAVGLLTVCLIAGGVLAWAYSRAQWPGSSPSALLYPLIVASLPITIRSDSLGLIKETFYPLLMVWLVMLVARASGAKSSNPDRVSVPAAR